MKLHFLISSGPFPFHEVSGCSAICGRWVSNPKPVLFYEVAGAGLPEFNSLRDCKDCFQKLAEKVEGQQVYVYGIANDQEIKYGLLNSGDLG